MLKDRHMEEIRRKENDWERRKVGPTRMKSEE